MIDSRLLFIWFSILSVLLWLIIGIFRIQVTKGDYFYKLSQGNCLKNISILAPRGCIYDRKKKLLVGNKPSFNIFFIKRELRQYPQTIQRIAEIMNKDVSDVWRRVNRSSNPNFLPDILFQDISREKFTVIEEHSFELPGIFVKISPKRYYPYGTIGAHVLGYIGKVNAKEFKALRVYGYKKRDFLGKSGLELSYEHYLRGKDGGRQVQVNSLGHVDKILGYNNAEKGKNLITTLDIDIQKIVKNALVGHKGAVIVMDPFSNEILALASAPSFDPNLFISLGSHKKQKQLKKILFNSKDRPLLNRAISVSVSPGSTFKIFMGLIALIEHKISPITEIFCSGSYKIGRVFHCWKKRGHGHVNLKEALRESCNVFFYELSKQISIDKIVFYTKKFGFGKKTTVDLPFEKQGFVPTRAWKKRRFHQKWYPGETANFSIGQGYLLVTPLQLLHNFNKIFNESLHTKPYIVKQIIDSEKHSFPSFYFKTKKLSFKKESIDLILNGMNESVNHPGGTAKVAYLEDINVSGKTGTVQVVGNKRKKRFGKNIPERYRNHAWFIGFAPFDNPQVTLVIFLEHGRSGGEYASKVAHDIFKGIFALPSYSIYASSTEEDS